MTGGTNMLGEYLRARRELVTPDSVGLPQLGIRRVPGLRREEVAMLAGISADYYLRLEQGRDRNPSGTAPVIAVRRSLPAGSVERVGFARIAGSRVVIS
jgi:hypothetical protein